MNRPDLDRYIAGWRGPLLAALLTLLAGLPGLLLLPPLDRDESRYAQATSQMLESGDYVDIRFQDEPRWKKPVGIYWLQAAAVSLTSDVEDREIGLRERSVAAEPDAPGDDTEFGIRATAAVTSASDICFGR